MFDIRQTKAGIIAAASVQNDRLVQAYIRINEMREALKPFAEIAVRMDGGLECLRPLQDNEIMFGNVMPEDYPTARDLRRARRAYEQA